MDRKTLKWTAVALGGGTALFASARWFWSRLPPVDGQAALADFSSARRHADKIVVPRPFFHLLRDFPEDPDAPPVRVAVLDTGYMLLPGILDGKLIAAHKSFCNTASTTDAHVHRHGTSVACLIAGEPDAFNQLPLPVNKRFEGGVVPRLGGRVELLIGKVCEGAFATHKDLAAALRWAVEEHADVVCVAFELEDSPAQCLLDALKDADCAGVMVVMASGNSGRSGLDLPKHNTIVSVGAHDIRGSACHFTRSGATLLAPGTQIVAPCGFHNDDDASVATCFFEGSSAATALMAGVIAIMKSRSMFSSDIQAFISSLQQNENVRAGSRCTGDVLFEYVDDPVAYLEQYRDP